MRIQIQRAELSRLLAATTKVVEARSTIPILSTVRLEAAADRLTVTATDLDIEVQSAAPCTAEPGAVCVDAKLLAGIVGKAAGAEIALELDGAALTVKSGRSRFTLQTLPAEDFPTLAAGKFTTEFEADLAALFAPVAFAISTEETRFYLNGVYLVGSDANLTAVATDGHRLSRHTANTVGPFEGIIIPRKTVGLVPKSTATVSLSNTKIRFTTADAVITSKLIDGTFPDYQRVIPRNNDKVVTVDRNALAKAVDRVSVVSSERGRAVKLSIAPGQIVLSVNNPDSGSATEEVAASYDGEPIEIGFNASYLAEVLENLSGDEATIKLADGGSPTLLTGGGEGLDVTLMPMRTN